MAMSDDRGGRSEYDWLYSPGSDRADRRSPPEKPERPWEPPADGDADDADAPADDDGATQATARDPGAGEHADPEATQAMALPPSEVDNPDTPRPESDDGADAGEHTEVIERPADADPQSPSFGGVYPSPAPGAQRRTDPSSLPPRSAPPSARTAPPSARPPAKKAATSGGGRNYRKWAVRGVLIVLALWLIFLIVVPIWAWQHISKVDAEPGGSRPSDTPGTTYLLVGSDSRAGLSKEQAGKACKHLWSVGAYCLALSPQVLKNPQAIWR